jgi:enamine deaminase RidA (YjgF/YER057c/UK114 family)
MMIEAKLAELGITLPAPAAPVASYVPAVEANGMLFISGQLPFVDGKVVTGKVGDTRSLEEGKAAAKACGIMLIAQMKAALGGDLDRVESSSLASLSHRPQTLPTNQRPPMAHRT